MQLNLRNLLLNNTTLKISAFIIGCALWSILNESFRAHLTLAVPVCYYHVPTQGIINSPEEVKIILSGSPSAIRNINAQEVVAHVNAEKLVAGKQAIELNKKNLLLPAEVSLVNYSPLEVTLSPTE